VQATIEKYGEKLESFDVVKFNKNIVDPIKLIFDKTVYRSTWDEIVSSEVFRQRDKSNNNDIGYFHQRIFQYIDNCRVPDAGWDIIFESEEGIDITGNSDIKHKIYVEMKNKHNTMNSSSASHTYNKMRNQVMDDDDCACFLVEVVSKKSQNIVWETTIKKAKKRHNLIRKVSIDQFYAIVTGQQDAFFQMCMVLPEIVERVVKSGEITKMPKDEVTENLQNIANYLNPEQDELKMSMAVYMLGFSDYEGFSEMFGDDNALTSKNRLRRIYEYAKKLDGK
jgi:hypothetical protein